MTNFDTIMWGWPTMTPVSRPPMDIPWEKKDQAYDATAMRYFLSGTPSTWRNSYLREYALNVNMVQNGPSSFGSAQMIREFLGDENNPTGRLALRYAIAQAMHTRLVGVADAMSVDAKAESWTSHRAMRKEAALYDRLLKAQAAQAGSPLTDAMAQVGVSPDEDAERDLHENLWTDPYERAISDLIAAMSDRQKLRGKQRMAASHLVLSGVIASHQYSNGNHIEHDLVEPAEAGWDPAALRPDLSDGEFCWTAPLMDVSSIAERFQPAADVIRHLDAMANIWAGRAGFNSGNNSRGPNKYRVFTLYFKDKIVVERGFVLEDGTPTYTTINQPGPDGKPRWTDKDLIAPPENDMTALWTPAERRAKKQRRQAQRLRFCTAIPWEFLPGAITGAHAEQSNGYKDRVRVIETQGAEGQRIISCLTTNGDLVLDCGELPDQEIDVDDKFQVEFPLKFTTWKYLNGTPIAPLSSVRDMQDITNATLSDMVMRMSRAEIPTTVFDDDALVGAGTTADQAAANLKIGRSFSIKSSIVGGINQAITTTGNTLGADFYNRFSIIDHWYQMIQNATGVYDQNFGAPSGGDMLVRVKELQNRQSGTMLAPFLGAIGDLFEQNHQFNASVGKKFYSSRPWMLERMVGDDGQRVILLSRDMENERFRVRVILTADADSRKEQAAQMILAQGGYLDRQFLDRAEAARLLSIGALPEDVNEAAARFTRRLAQAEAMAAQQQQQQQQAATAMQMGAQLDQREDELARRSTDAALKQEQMQRKSMQPIVQALSRHVEPQNDAAAIGQ